MTRFYGDELSGIELEVRALRIDPEHRKDEAGLMRLRWWDYRNMHPVTATYCFAHHYVEQTRTFYERYIDIRTADETRAFSPDDIFSSRDMTSMWLARQAADQLGVPYPFVLDFAGRRAHDRLFRRFPRPNQLYGEEFELDVRDAWQATRERSIQYSTADRFKHSAPSSDLKREHAQAVVCQILARQRPQWPGLLGRMFNEGVLHPDSIEGVEEGVLEQAKAVAARLGSVSHH